MIFPLKEEAPRSLRLTVRKMTWLPVVLLYGMTAAVLLCLGVMTVFYGYWLIEKNSSQYRRQMNAAAYSTQIFFDQREQLLRATAASVVPNLKKLSASEMPGRLGSSQQIRLFPLRDGADRFQWSLVLMPRAFEALEQAQVELVYTAMDTGTTQVVLRDERPSSFTLSEQTQRWIHDRLSAQTGQLRPGEAAPVVWLTPPGTTVKKLFMYLPLDASDPQAGWLGIAISDIASRLDFSHLHGSSFALYAPDGQPIVFGAGAPQSAYLDLTEEDGFAFEPGHSYLERFVLSKSVGDAGWRLRYFMPRDQLLKDVLPRWSWAFGLFVLALVGICSGSRQIHRRMLQPASAHMKQLAESVALNHALLHATPVGLALVRRRDHALLLSNAQGRDWLPEQLLRALPHESLSSFEQEWHREDGQVLQVTLTPLRYEGEAAVLCTLHDVTRLKQAEQSLMAAKQEAELACQAKTDFLTTMSHEIRTPLYGVMGSLELLALTSITAQQRRYLDALQHSSNALLATVNNTLDLARIEAGHQSLEQAPFSPLQLVEEVVSSFAMRAESKGLQLYFMVDASTPARVLGHVQLVRQVLDNFVNNAIKFTESGSVLLRLHSEVTAQEQVGLRFQVIDTGIGMTAENVQRVFEPYFRVEGANAFRGTGLGLSICARLAQVLQARLNAKSQLGVGTCMELELRVPVDPSSETDGMPQLLAAPVYVRGGASDAVALTCAWLRRWGAKALPYRADLPEQEGAVLLETWPPTQSIADWSGPRVLAQPLSQAVEQTSAANTWQVSAYSLLEMGRAIQMAQEAGLQRADSAAAKQPGHVRTPMHLRVLVVEDHPVTRMILIEQLQQLGCEVESVQNGKEALQLQNIMSFDLIFTDWNMPILNGLEMTAALRSRGYGRPIICMTAAMAEATAVQGKAAGATKMVGKPMAMHEVIKILQDFV